MSAPRLLVVGDAGGPTGFGRVVDGIATALHTRGDFDVTVAGVGLPHAQAEREAEDRARAGAYARRAVSRRLPEAPLGHGEFAATLAQTRPDVVLVVQDLWHLAGYLAPMPRALPRVAYFPVDAPNVAEGHAFALGAVGVAATYTHFAAREAAAGVRAAADLLAATQGAHLARPTAYVRTKADGAAADGAAALEIRLDRLARWQNVGAWNVVPHGLDRTRFAPPEAGDRAAARRRFGVPAAAFVVLAVGANQYRKRLDLTLRAFAGFAAARQDAHLVLHCAGGARSGWDLPQLVRYLGLGGRVTLVHEAAPVLDDDALRQLYHTADVQLNTAGGEGWGLPAFEGAACGVPQLVPDWSATRELWRGHGVLLPVRDYRFEPFGLNTAHAVVDVAATAEALGEIADDATIRGHMTDAALAQAARQLAWDEVGGAFASLLASAREEPPALPGTLVEVLAARRGDARSELAAPGPGGVA